MIQVFRGIRYATANRFEKPQPAGCDWDDLQLIAPPQPPQYGFEYLPMSLDSEVDMGEDCLRLTIYTPDRAGNRPVLVWIHGGAFG